MHTRVMKHTHHGTTAAITMPVECVLLAAVSRAGAGMAPALELIVVLAALDATAAVDDVPMFVFIVDMVVTSSMADIVDIVDMVIVDMVDMVVVVDDVPMPVVVVDVVVNS